jgi:hypothetical protein
MTSISGASGSSAAQQTQQTLQQLLLDEQKAQKAKDDANNSPVSQSNAEKPVAPQSTVQSVLSTVVPVVSSSVSSADSSDDSSVPVPKLSADAKTVLLNVQEQQASDNKSPPSSVQSNQPPVSGKKDDVVSADSGNAPQGTNELDTTNSGAATEQLTQNVARQTKILASHASNNGQEQSPQGISSVFA